MKIIGIIPVRYGSKRFPGKVLAVLRGKTILQHVYERAVESGVLDKVIIAVDDGRLKKTAEQFGAEVMVTPVDCRNGSERAACAVTGMDCDVVVNIQGDQPLFPLVVLSKITASLRRNTNLLVSTAVYPLKASKYLDDPNIVKVALDKNGFALYFSRSVVPFQRNKVPGAQLFYKHIGIYAYRKEFLLEYAKMPPGPLEMAESLEQLRVLENGYRIKTVISEDDSISIDTKADLARLRKKMPRA